MLFPINNRGTDPLSIMRSMAQSLDDLAPVRPTQKVFPAVNIWQGEDVVAVTAELPGIDPESVDISVKDNVLTISGERKAPEVPEGARWHRNERAFGKFSRSSRLPFNASEAKVEARMHDGVLRVAIGRPEQDKPKKIKIKTA